MLMRWEICQNDTLSNNNEIYSEVLTVLSTFSTTDAILSNQEIEVADTLYVIVNNYLLINIIVVVQFVYI